MNTLYQIEHDILLWIQENLRCNVLDLPMKIITTLGDAGAIWIGLTLVLLFFRRTRRTGLFCAGAILLTFLVVNCAVKPLVARMRPYEYFQDLVRIVGPQSDKSFPSGHSANSLACAWALMRVGKRHKLDILALVLAILIALSRLYVGVHYPTDVLCGAIIGMICCEIAIRILKKLWPRIKPRILPPKKEKAKA